MSDEQWYGAPIEIRYCETETLPWTCAIDCTCGDCVTLAPTPEPRVIELEY